MSCDGPHSLREDPRARNSSPFRPARRAPQETSPARIRQSPASDSAPRITIGAHGVEMIVLETHRPFRRLEAKITSPTSGVGAAARRSFAPEQGDEALGADPRRHNDFDFSEDPKGLVCPHSAHMRRLNPRDSRNGSSSCRSSPPHAPMRRHPDTCDQTATSALAWGCARRTGADANRGRSASCGSRRPAARSARASATSRPHRGSALAVPRCARRRRCWRP